MAEPVAQPDAQADDRPATERVADELRDRIKHGKLAPGQRLVEVDLIRQLRVSRSTIRAAFGQLATEGIVTLELNRGARVRQLEPDEIRELYELRATLEGRAAGLTAGRIDLSGCRAEMQALAERNADFRDGSSFGDYWNFNERLHRVVLQWCGNHMLRNMAEQTRTLSYHYHLLAASHGDPGKAVSIGHACIQHREMLNAVLSGDAVKAEHSMREHVAHNGHLIAAFFEAEQRQAARHPMSSEAG